jgi:ABC-type glycerol-3-phosphate transport system substrate-binding protein
MESQKLNRRGFLRLAAMTAGGLALAGCQAPPAQAPAQAPAEKPAEKATQPPPTAAPAASALEVVVWYQSWPGSDAILARVKPIYEGSHANVTLKYVGLDYGDLNSKFLPSIAAGTEGDANQLYTNWVVATDVTKVLLDVTDVVGGAAALAEKMWPAALSATAMPKGKIYYLPWLAGIRGACITVVNDHLKEAGIDYLAFKNFDDIIAAGKKLTKRDAAGKITRSGWSPESALVMLFLSYIWQLGGEFLDEAKGKWSLQTPEAKAAFQYLADMYWVHKTVDFGLWESEFDAQGRGVISICAQGAWTGSFMTDTQKIPSDNIVTPPLPNAKKHVLYPDHIACWGLSKRLAKEPQKLKATLDLALLLTGPEGLVDAFQDYSGVCMTKAVYQDPRISKVKFGLMSKRIAEGMWPIARFPQTYVANLGLMSDALTRALKKELAPDAALTEMEQILQKEEDASRKRVLG